MCVSVVVVFEHPSKEPLRGLGISPFHQAREAADTAYELAGATAIFNNNAFERRFRDIHTVTQQLQGRRSHFRTVGAYQLGQPPDMTVI